LAPSCRNPLCPFVLGATIRQEGRVKHLLLINQGPDAYNFESLSENEQNARRLVVRRSTRLA
jgi:hypothetical protein